MLRNCPGHISLFFEILQAVQIYLRKFIKLHDRKSFTGPNESN